MEIGRQSVPGILRSPQYAAAGCRTRTHYQDPWPAINILVDSLWYIQSLITLLFIKVTELFGIQSKKCFSIINTFSLLIDRLFTLSLQEAPRDVYVPTWTVTRPPLYRPWWSAGWGTPRPGPGSPGAPGAPGAGWRRGGTWLSTDCVLNTVYSGQER